MLQSFHLKLIWGRNTCTHRKRQTKLAWESQRSLHNWLTRCGAIGQGTPSSGAGAPHSPSNANSTLSRPMASTGGTRYEDRTIRRHREVTHCPWHSLLHMLKKYIYRFYWLSFWFILYILWRYLAFHVHKYTLWTAFY